MDPYHGADQFWRDRFRQAQEPPGASMNSCGRLDRARDYANQIHHSLCLQSQEFHAAGHDLSSDSALSAGYAGGYQYDMGSYSMGAGSLNGFSSSAAQSSISGSSQGSHRQGRSAGGSGSGGAANNKFNRGWQLLWCQEHCFKAFGDNWRSRLQDCANAYGADMACLKKARKIFEHFRRMSQLRPPANFQHFGVATVWREAKPLISVFEKVREAQLNGTLDSLEVEGVDPWFAVLTPVFVAIFCEHEVQHAKAVRWVESKSDFPAPIYCLIGCHEDAAEDAQRSDLQALLPVLEAASRGRTGLPDPALYNVIIALPSVDQEDKPKRMVVDVNDMDREHLQEALSAGAYLRL